MITKQEKYQFRKERTKRNLLKAGVTWPRLSVYRSDKYIYAQVIDDIKGSTIACASSLDKEIKGQFKSGKNIAASRLVGGLIAKRALEKGVKEIRFDRGGRRYHGRIKALADAAREAGLKF
ncbi:MAG: 50S ribosomal protein L18 [Elusimicrobia bacterium]|nr:50S ribosomal protein L18 [Elusimicrobiota bacterium]